MKNVSFFVFFCLMILFLSNCGGDVVVDKNDQGCERDDSTKQSICSGEPEYDVLWICNDDKPNPPRNHCILPNLPDINTWCCTE